MTVPSLLLERWQSGDLTGDAPHAGVVRVRPGHVEHGYFDENRLDNGSPIFPPLIWKGNNHHCWKGRWVADGPWVTLPNIQNIKWSKSYTNQVQGTNAATTATILMDNIAFIEQHGVAGIFHDIERGYFSPSRGFQSKSRPNLWQSTGWDNVLNGGYQIEVWEGYGTGAEVQPNGDSTVKTFTGLIEGCDLESHPDHITITARDFSVLLTDQRMMGWNKAAEIRAPITFADRKQTQGEGKVTGGVTVSDGTWATDQKLGAQWVSNPHSSATPAALPYIDLTLPAGHYETFALTDGFDGMEVFVALNVVAPASYDNSVTIGSGWVDAGLGNVPGTAIPFIRSLAKLDDDPHRWNFGFAQTGFDFSDGSHLRLYFNNLKLGADGNYYAAVNSLYALRYGTNPNVPPGAQVNAKHWILVDDAADVIRMILIWAGFQEWHVENFGWTLKHPLQFGEDKFFMDVVNEMLQQGNFVFYMGDPTTNDMSLGVPHFEPQKATAAPPPGIIEVRDTDGAEGMQPNWDMSNLPYVIRFRGDVTPHGQTLDQDLVKRFTATYYPPWSDQYSNLSGRGQSTKRVAGVRRHFSQTIGSIPSMSLESTEECLFACLLAAVQFCLQLCTGQLQIAGLPGAFDLNGQLSIVESSTAVNSRLWIASIESEHTFGEQGKWEMTIGGALIDTEDMYLIAADFQIAYKRMLPQRPPSMEDDPAPRWDPGVADVIHLVTGQ